MKGTYDIYFGSEVIGTATVEQEGLYYDVHCLCRLTGDVMFRVSVSCADRCENLGTLIPMGDSFGLTTRLAVKKLGKGTLQFRVIPKRPQTSGRFVPVYPEEPFAYLQYMQSAFWEQKNGQAGVVITGK